MYIKDATGTIDARIKQNNNKQTNKTNKQKTKRTKRRNSPKNAVSVDYFCVQT